MEVPTSILDAYIMTLINQRSDAHRFPKYSKIIDTKSLTVRNYTKDSFYNYSEDDILGKGVIINCPEPSNEVSDNFAKALSSTVGIEVSSKTLDE